MNRTLGYAALAGAAAASLLFAATSASATIFGTIYEGDPTSTDASVVPSSTLAHADFTATAINFNTNCSDCTTVADFLNNPTFTNAQNGFDPNGLTDNTFIELTGSAFLLSGDNSFVVGHDDGVVVWFPDLSSSPVVSAPGPTGLDETPFNVNNPGAAGLYSFKLQYTECCGGPADLDFTVNGSAPNAGGAPEPASWALMIGGFGLAGASLRRRRAGVAA
jgi:hypothetical protein